jgi:hypothetical protein
MDTSSQLQHEIESIVLVDTHEHLHKEDTWLGDGPDILGDLFANYPASDLRVAGATAEAVERLYDPSSGDLESRFEPVRAAWEAIRFTGYGEGVRLIARTFYGLDELTVEGLAAAQETLDTLRQPGERLRLLRDEARLDHVQVDDFVWACLPDASGSDFFLYDISWVAFVNGSVDVDALHATTGVEVASLDDLRTAFAALFERYADCAIAVKSQHAYSRTLAWSERSDDEAARALQAVLAGGDVDESTRLLLGDWCLARGAELAAEHNLPFKIHTGHLAGTGNMPVDRVRPNHLCGLLARYPQTRFVLMHISYPYNDELISIAKHFPNVYADLCWAWSINPYAATDFVRRFLHAVPINKLFAFGGDTMWPTAASAYAAQARKGLARALEAEVAAGDLTEQQAIGVARRVMRENQLACFDVEGARGAAAAQLQAVAAT